MQCIDTLQTAIHNMAKDLIVMKKHIVKLEKKVYGYSLKEVDKNEVSKLRKPDEAKSDWPSYTGV